jgi:hypothetical protein
MTDRATLLALAERVEKAHCAGRGLDAVISCALRIGPDLPDWAASWSGEWRPTMHGSAVLLHEDGKPGPHFTSPAYTASLDAAMTLVPEGASWSLTSALEDEPPCATVLTMESTEHGLAATPALALCAAALRARAEAGDE